MRTTLPLIFATPHTTTTHHNATRHTTTTQHNNTTTLHPQRAPAVEPVQMPPHGAIFSGYFLVKKETEEGEGAEGGGDGTTEKSSPAPKKMSKVLEDDVELTFTKDGSKFRVTGTGVNKFGEFTLTGRG